MLCCFFQLSVSEGDIITLDDNTDAYEWKVGTYHPYLFWGVGILVGLWLRRILVRFKQILFDIVKRSEIKTLGVGQQVGGGPEKFHPSE